MDQLRALKVFARVVDEGGFAAAARALDMAPPVVTRIVAELEAHLGSRLLNRTTRSLALTETGQTYLALTRRAVADIEAADALAGDAASTLRGTLRVLSPPAFAAHQLAAVLPRFRERHPQLALELEASGPVDSAGDQFDVSIVSVGQQPLQGEFVARPLAGSYFVLCAAPAYLRRRGRPEQPDDLLVHEALLPAVSATRRELVLQRLAPPASRAGADDLARSWSAPTPPAALSTSHLEVLLASVRWRAWGSPGYRRSWPSRPCARAGSNVCCRAGSVAS